MTGVKTHTTFPVEVTTTSAGNEVLTIIVISSDMAGFALTHDSSDVSLHFTISPLDGGYVYVEFVSPATTIPFTYQVYSGLGPPLEGVAV